jgi:hypothetical protein
VLTIGLRGANVFKLEFQIPIFVMLMLSTVQQHSKQLLQHFLSYINSKM